MMTRDQLAAELLRISKLQLSDITRAVKNGEKSIALNEVVDLGRRLNRLADLVAGRPAQTAAIGSPNPEPEPEIKVPGCADSALVGA